MQEYSAIFLHIVLIIPTIVIQPDHIHSFTFTQAYYDKPYSTASDHAHVRGNGQSPTS